MSSLVRSLPLAALAALSVPAAASAATYTVGSSDSVAAAAAKAQPGDVIDISGIHKESVEVKAAGVIVRGHPGAALVGSPSAKSGTPTLKLSAASGSPDSVTGLLVANLVTTDPAISAGAAGLALADAYVIGTGGPALGVGGSTTVQRSFLAGTDAISIASSATAAKSLTVDSSVLLGAAGGAGIRANSAGALGSLVTGAPGTMTIAARHVTIAGAKSPVVLTANAPDPTAVAGDITASLTDSIAIGAAATSRASTRQLPVPGLPSLPGLPSPVSGLIGSLTTPGSGLPSGPAAGGRTSLTLTRTLASGDPAALFVDPARWNYRLRADSPAIGKGGFTSGESTTDIDGEPRAVNGASDLGADQFVNHPPTAKLGAAGATVREGRAVAFDASASRDPEAAIGGGIVSYRWSFGDGQTASTTTPSVSHAYAKRGSYTATVVTVDRQGGTSAPASAAITVLDGIPPTLRIGQPAAHQKVSRRARALLAFGTVSDDAGVRTVQVAVRSTRRASDGRCRWLDPKRGLRARSCAKPTFLVPKVDNGQWQLKVPVAHRLRPGVYELLAVAYDTSGLASAPATARFRVR